MKLLKKHCAHWFKDFRVNSSCEQWYSCPENGRNSIPRHKPETSSSSTEDDSGTLPATPPLTLSLPVLSHQRFSERTDKTSLSADHLVIRSWEFVSDNDASWPRFKQTELIRTIEGQNNRDETGWLRRNTKLFYKWHCGLWRHGEYCLGPTIVLCASFRGVAWQKWKSPSNALAQQPDCEISQSKTWSFKQEN